MKHKIIIRRDKRGLGHLGCARLIRKAAAMALEAEGILSPCEISVVLTDNEGIREINREFRGIDSPTDVLSFPLNEPIPGRFEEELCEHNMDSGRIMLGDMMLSLPRCEEQGRQFGHGFEREIMYLSVHSVLHLLGYDHVDEGEMKKQMRSREKAIMGDTAEQ